MILIWDWNESYYYSIYIIKSVHKLKYYSRILAYLSNDVYFVVGNLKCGEQNIVLLSIHNFLIDLYFDWIKLSQIQISMTLSNLLNDIFTLFIFLAFLVRYDTCWWILWSKTQNSLWLQCKYSLFLRIFLHAWWNTLF